MPPKKRADISHASSSGGSPESPQSRSDCCTILDSFTDGVFAVDREFRITFFNRAAEKITGYRTDEALGRHCSDVLHSAVCHSRCPLRRTMSSGEPVHDCLSTIVSKAGAKVSVNISTAPMVNDKGEAIGGVEIFRDISVVETLRNVIAERYRFRELISKNRRMQDIFEILPDIAESDSAVLIQGPSGSGKEVVATAIHDLSLRKDRPFVKINCGAIPDTLLESELFGYLKGAFTDARRDKPGRFVLANHGTMFLDEIGDTSPALQVKLLRVLEEKQFVPLGGTDPVKVDVRIIAASHKNIDKLVEAGTFRDDLYYRLNIIKIQLPPLKERKEDIPLLVENFISRLSLIKGKNIFSVSEEVFAILMNYHFPGNVRELENILEHAYVLSKGPVIETRHLPPDLLEKTLEGDHLPDPLRPLESSEAQAIQQILQKHKGRRVAAADELGMSRATLWRRIRKYHLDSIK